MGSRPARRLAAAAAIAVSVLAAPARADRGQEYVSLALRGKLDQARPLLLDVAPDRLTAKERELADRYRTRFVERTERVPPLGRGHLVQDVVDAYRDYWTKALMGELAGEAGDRFLAEDLRAVLARHGIRPPDDDDPVERAGKELERVGLFRIGGKTLPFFELMLWARQDTTRYDVELTDGPRTVEVVFVRDFLVRGWAEWATFGRASTGGWATKERLFCLADDYDLESERFLVSYLKHEGRHFADYPLFPALAQPDLEYRAKLTELAYLEGSLHDALGHFAGAASLDPDAPHAWANACVVRDVSRELFGEPATAPDDPRWEAVDPAAVHAAARKLLESHTARLVAAGADTTTGVVGPGAR